MKDLQKEAELQLTPELLARSERYLKVILPFDLETTGVI